MRGRKILPILLVLVLVAGTIHFILPPVLAYSKNVGVDYVGASAENPVRVEQLNTTVIVNAYNDGWEGGPTAENFNVNAYYYNDTYPKTLIGTLNFILTTDPFNPDPQLQVQRNETAKALVWNITSVKEGTYRFYANITNVPGGDQNAADNTRDSELNSNPRQRQLGIIWTHNLGVANVQGSMPDIIKAGSIYTISLNAYNSGYFAESFTVTTYYNRSDYPDIFVSINITTITNLPAKSGAQSWTVLWNTTGCFEDRYSISANASVVADEEKITYDQFDFRNEMVTVIEHDIAVLDVVAYPTGQTLGQLVKVNVTVENQGAVTEGTVTVRVKANTTEIPASPQYVYNLASGANKTLTFNWNPAATGFYILNGSADFVTGERFQRTDNVFRLDDVRRRVHVPALHDVATTFVSTNATYAKPGDPIGIFAVVENWGDFDESFSVTPYYEGTQAASPQIAIINKRNDTGEDYGRKELGFVWDTTGVALGTYNIKVAASLIGDFDPSNNNFTDGRIVFTKVYIDPANKIVDVSGTYNVKPTTHTLTLTPNIANPANAYDNNNATYASLLVTTSSSNYVTFHGFTTPGLTTNVAQVDVKIRYSALAVPVDVYRITQGVGPSVTNATLVNWNAVGIAAATLFEYNNRSEPNDGAWSWTDVQNMHVRFESDDQIADSHTVRAYEVWALVYTSEGGNFTCRPTANTKSGVTVTNEANAYDGNVGTYAYFTTSADGYFSVRSFSTGGGSGTISRVDLRVTYYISSSSDRFEVRKYVNPSTSPDTLVSLGGTTSDQNIPLETYVFSYRPEPNDGNWSWTDVSNMRVRFTPYLSGATENREVRIYEIWATVYDNPLVVTYNVGGVSSMYAWSAVLSWDPKVLECVSAVSSGFFTGYASSFSKVINNTGGYAELSETILYTGSKSGSGALAKLIFKVINTGKSTIIPNPTFLVNTQGQKMEHFVERGRFKTPGTTLIGDFNSDGAVDATDISMFNQQYGKRLGDPGYNDIYDLFNDNVIDAKDLRLIGTNYF